MRRVWISIWSYWISHCTGVWFRPNNFYGQTSRGGHTSCSLDLDCHFVCIGGRHQRTDRILPDGARDTAAVPFGGIGEFPIVALDYISRD